MRVLLYIGIMVLVCTGVVYAAEPKATVITVAEAKLPFTKQVVLTKKGDAYRLKLPDGKELAFWCIRQPFPMGEQTTASGLGMMWGEKPFQHSPVVYERDGADKKAKTYITFGGVSTSSRTKKSESGFSIGSYNITLTRHLGTKKNLPVDISVTRKKEKAK